MDDGAIIHRFTGEPPSPWEDAYGFSRAVSVGPWLLVGGTTAADPTGCVIGESPYEQMAEVCRKLLGELARAGMRPDRVVQLRAYVTDISRADEVGRAYREVFGDVRPLLTMVEVSALIDPRLLVEVELVAHRPISAPAGGATA